MKFFKQARDFYRLEPEERLRILKQMLVRLDNFFTSEKINDSTIPHMQAMCSTLEQQLHIARQMPKFSASLLFNIDSVINGLFQIINTSTQRMEDYLEKNQPFLFGF